MDTDHSTSPEDRSQFLSFRVGDELYAVDILRVREIRRWTGATRIPNAAPGVQGVVNVRGAVIPIVELRMRIGLETTTYEKTSVVILVHVVGKRGDRTVGMLVEAVSDVINADPDAVRTPPDGASSSHFIQGLIGEDEHTVIVLDADKLLEDTSDASTEVAA